VNLRVHSHTLTGLDSVNILAVPQSWTREDPGLSFLSLNDAPFLQISSATPSPAYLTFSLPMGGANCMAAMMRLMATGSGSSTTKATVSVELSVLDV